MLIELLMKGCSSFRIGAFGMLTSCLLLVSCQDRPGPLDKMDSVEFEFLEETVESKNGDIVDRKILKLEIDEEISILILEKSAAGLRGKVWAISYAIDGQTILVQSDKPGGEPLTQLNLYDLNNQATIGTWIRESDNSWSEINLPLAP